MKKTSHLTLSAMLVALALGLSYMERLIPLQLLIPLPGVKLGLANIVTMMALYFLGEKTAFAVLIARCLLGCAFGGSLTGLAMSLGGGIAAFLVMMLAKRLLFCLSTASAFWVQQHTIPDRFLQPWHCCIRHTLLHISPFCCSYRLCPDF